MLTHDVIACENDPHSSTAASELVGRLTRKFEQELSKVVATVGSDAFTPPLFRSVLSDLKCMFDGLGREAVTQLLSNQDPARAGIDVDGCRMRFRDVSKRAWLTVFGKITASRRVFRADGRGAASVVPLDQACGMSGRYMTPDVEEMAAIGMAMLTASEVELLLAKTLPQGPSATAIQNAVRRLGTEIEDQREAIESAIASEAPLSCEGDTLVVSWDGVMTPLRETTKIAWREAGVATVSIYGQTEDCPEKLDTRYLARMPEKGMKTLLEQTVEQVVRAKRGRVFREFAVVCDGKDTIWNAAAAHPELHDAVWILDFYHASENLMKAAKAIHGDDEIAAHRWHQKIRRRLRDEPRGADSAIRSMRRLKKALRKGSKRRKVVDNAIAYFCLHRDRMCYPEFVAMGLPIGSGNVESAAKNIVQARLKRSGMRWSRIGGQHVLDLRTYLKSGRWSFMWDVLNRVA